jgi:predicted Zn-dependent peptidase
MSSVIFQELRESKALAYSTYSIYRNPKNPKKNYVNFSYIGSQSDKLSEALSSLSELLDNLPKAEGSFNAAKESIQQDMRSQRIVKTEILFNYETALKFGLDHDIRKDVFDKVGNLTFDDVKKFQETNIKNKPRTVIVLGKKDLLNFKVMEKYGTIQTLELKDIFGY